jgi:hypothetical protein
MSRVSCHDGVVPPDRRRILLVAAVVAAIALLAVPALALSDWWFLGPGAPKPEGGVTVVASGRSAGIEWMMTAYVSKDTGVCVALTPQVGQGDSGALGCGADVRGEPNRGSARDRPGKHWVGYQYFALGLFDFPEFVFGPVAHGVDGIDLVLSSGDTLRTTTINGPDELNAPLDFYVVELPRGASIDSIIARDSSGTVLERRRCLRCSRPT